MTNWGKTLRLWGMTTGSDETSPIMSLMCGRYGISETVQQLAIDFDAVITDKQPEIDQWVPTADARPSQHLPTILAIRSQQSPHKIGLMSWGWTTNWSKRRLINARIETAGQQPTWSEALSKRRCAIPCSGWWEWKAADPEAVPPDEPMTEQGDGQQQPEQQPKPQQQQPQPKQRYWFQPSEPVAFAGLWQSIGPGAASFVICTTQATPQLARIHDRMPVLLTRGSLTSWLDAGTFGPSPAVTHTAT